MVSTSTKFSPGHITRGRVARSQLWKTALLWDGKNLYSQWGNVSIYCVLHSYQHLALSNFSPLACLECGMLACSRFNLNFLLMSTIAHHVLAFGFFYDLSTHLFCYFINVFFNLFLVDRKLFWLPTPWQTAMVWLISLLALFIAFCSVEFSNLNKTKLTSNFL